MSNQTTATAPAVPQSIYEQIRARIDRELVNVDKQLHELLRNGKNGTRKEWKLAGKCCGMQTFGCYSLTLVEAEVEQQLAKKYVTHFRTLLGLQVLAYSETTLPRLVREILADPGIAHEGSRVLARWTIQKHLVNATIGWKYVIDEVFAAKSARFMHVSVRVEEDGLDYKVSDLQETQQWLKALQYLLGWGMVTMTELQTMAHEETAQHAKR